MLKLTKKAGLTTIPLTLLITGAIDSIRNLPATALFGSSLVFFFIFSALVFLIPAALVSAELSAASTNHKNGIYYWISSALGTHTGMLAAWLQWINTMVWFPTILSFLVGTATYFINPSLAQNKFFLVAAILSIYWTLTWVNLKGFHTSAKFANVCTLIGMILPFVLIIGLAMAWIFMGKPLQIHFAAQSLFPSFTHFDNWISLTAIISAFLGIELATVHVKDVHQPQKTFPKALALSVCCILVPMILGSLAIAIVLPKDQINLVSGVMQAFTNFFAAYHLSYLIPLVTLMILIGSLGSMTSWVISPAKSLLQAAQDGYFPPALTKLNKNQVASNLLITQAVLVSLICLAFLLMPSVNGSYWLLTALSTQLYVLMYIIMFAAALVIKYKNKMSSANHIIPGGKGGLFLVCALGFIGCFITLFIGFIPPESLNIGSALHYEISFCVGLLAMISPVALLYHYKKNSKAAGTILIPETLIP
jgi:glutamate:GABA antiporter